MKPPKSYLDAFRHEQKDDRTDRVARTIVEDAVAERREKSRLLREARLERDAPPSDRKQPAQREGKGDKGEEVSEE